MEQKNFNDVRPDPKNPRLIGDHDYNALKKSILRFGDLSCVVFNVRTQMLVAGHQRWNAFKSFPGQKELVIDQHLEPANKQGTVAEGRLVYDNENYKYREVDWDTATAQAANVAPNRIMGQFDLDLLAQINYELAQEQNGAELLALSGQKPEEITQLLNMIGIGEPEKEPKELPMVLRVECSSDAQMNELYAELKDRGLNVRI